MAVLVNWLSPYNQAIGFWAAFLTTVAFAPQVIRTWRKGGDDLSWAMLTLFGFGLVLWLVYGIVQSATPVIVANAATGLQVLVIIGLKLRRAGKFAGIYDID